MEDPELLKYEVVEQNVADFDVNIVLHFVWKFDASRYDKLCSEYGSTITRSDIKNNLMVEDPNLYLCIQNIESMFMNSWIQANENAAVLARFYRGLKMARNEIKIKSKDLEVLDQKKNKLINKKKRIRKIIENEHLYNDVTPWTDQDMQEHYKVIEKKSIKSNILDSEWKFLHHCTGVWQAEDLLIAMQERGMKGAILRSMTIPSDLDMLRYKVISNKNFEKNKK